MPGSPTQAAATPPTPLELAGRALLATVLVLAMLQALGRPMVRTLIPVFRAAIPLLDPDFQTTDIRLTHVATDEVVRFRGNLSRPLVIHGTLVSPFGWNGMPAGGLQVTYTAGGILQYGAVLLIFVLAWPASGLRELACRLALASPFMALLPSAIVPITVVAGFRDSLESLVAPAPPGAALMAGRYLMGGGGWAIAVLAAAICIERARRLPHRLAA